MRVNPITFQSTQPNRTQENKTLSKGEKIALGVTTLALTAGTTALMLSRRPDFIRAFEKSGITVKDGIVIVKETGEKYTGVIKSRYGKLKLKKETTEFVDGVLKEHLRYDMFGRESVGYFYKNGKIKYEVGVHTNGKNALFHIVEFNDQGLGVIFYDCRRNGKETAFENVRNMLKNNSDLK